MGRRTTNNVTDLIEALSEELRALIARRNLSQRQLESASGVSQGVISKTIYRQESVLNLSQFEAICEALGASPSSVLARAERAVAEAERAQRPAVVLPQEAQADYARAAKHRPRRPEPREEDYF